jgi:hypothetical protein
LSEIVIRGIAVLRQREAAMLPDCSYDTARQLIECDLDITIRSLTADPIPCALAARASACPPLLLFGHAGLQCIRLSPFESIQDSVVVVWQSNTSEDLSSNGSILVLSLVQVIRVVYTISDTIKANDS